MLLYKAEVREHASRRMLFYFIPTTIIFTPLGQIIGDRVSTDRVEAIGGVLVTVVAIFELYQKRALFASWFCGFFFKKQDLQEGANRPSKGMGETERSETSPGELIDEDSTRMGGKMFSALYDIQKKVRRPCCSEPVVVFDDALAQPITLCSSLLFEIVARRRKFFHRQARKAQVQWEVICDQNCHKVQAARRGGSKTAGGGGNAAAARTP
jgi:hypothetical protein